ncbi:polysaccharide deacetylase family protein [Brevibacillus formosus]|nr:polysaccharide deacetylase [Brevibacillus formosus]
MVGSRIKYSRNENLTILYGVIIMKARLFQMLFLFTGVILLWSFLWPTVEYAKEAPPTKAKGHAPAVLTYHHIDESDQSSATITPELLRSHLVMLKENGYNVIGMEALLEAHKQNKSLPSKSVVLTFDDGYESFYTHAAPLLKEFGMTATNFVVVESTDQKNPNELPHLSWDQMRELEQQGMTFYSHTYDSHQKIPTDTNNRSGPALTSRKYLKEEGRLETYKEYHQRIKADISLANQRLVEELGEQPALLAFPYGAYDETVLDISRSLDIELMFAANEGEYIPGSKLLYRMNAGTPSMSAEDLAIKLKNHFR